MAKASSKDPTKRGRSTDASKPKTFADPRYSQSLERGLAILRCFNSERPLLGIAQIADQLGMSRSTTHRYMITLVALGFLEQGPSRKYRLGLRATDLGLAAIGAAQLRAVARPFLEDLRAQSSCFTSLAVLDHDDVCWLDTVPAPSLPPTAGLPLLQAGSRMPAHCTAEGKLLLAFLPTDIRTTLVARMSLTQQGPNTITTSTRLLSELGAIRDRGFALAEREQAPGVFAIAAPVRGRSDAPIAAVSASASGSAVSIARLVDTVAPQLTECAGRISERLDHPDRDAG